METSNTGEMSPSTQPKGPCRRNEFWKNRGRKMKKICCCFALLLLFQLIISLHLCHKVDEIFVKVEDLDEESNKISPYFCSDFCLNMCNNNLCDVYACQTSCKTTINTYYADSSLSSSDSSEVEEINYNDEYQQEEDPIDPIDPTNPTDPQDVPEQDPNQQLPEQGTDGENNEVPNGDQTNTNTDTNTNTNTNSNGDHSTDESGSHHRPPKGGKHNQRPEGGHPNGGNKRFLRLTK